MRIPLRSAWVQTETAMARLTWGSGAGLRIGIGLALAALPLAAADASTAGMSSATPPPTVMRAQAGDACAAIDDATAAQALGGPVQRNSGPGLPGMCSWRSTATPGDALTVQVEDGGQAKYDFDHGNLRVHDLSGVGDEAFGFASPAGFVQLGMMKGGTYVTIVLQRQNTSDIAQRAVELAKAIAAGM